MCSASTKSTFRISLTKSGYTPVIIGAITGLPSNVTVESTNLSGNTLTMIVQNSNTSTTTINSLGIYPQFPSASCAKFKPFKLELTIFKLELISVKLEFW